MENKVKHNNNLIWLDMEMSGLDPENDKVLEIAVVITDPFLKIIAGNPYASYRYLRCFSVAILATAYGLAACNSAVSFEGNFVCIPYSSTEPEKINRFNFGTARRAASAIFTAPRKFTLNTSVVCVKLYATEVCAAK